MGSAAEHHLAAHETMADHSVNLHTGLETNLEDIIAVKRLWDQIERPMEPQPCLVDGHWIMARTGAVEGMRLGRLKQWLHRIQIEEGLTTLSEMEAALSKLPYEHGDVEAWPRPVFP